MVSFMERSALGGYSHQSEGLSVTELTGFELVSIAVAKGSETNFKKQFNKVHKSNPPDPNQALPVEGGSVIWTGQNQFLVFLGTSDIYADVKLGKTLGDSAYPVLQSDGWACLRLEGDQFYSVMERFIPLDLRRAPEDFAARTQAHHISVIVVKQPDGSWLLLTPRSTAQSFLEALTHVMANVLRG